MPLGYHRRILRVNLTDGQIAVETPDGVFYRRYLGGAGFIAYYLLKEVPPGTDPLGPENRLIFACGPLTGWDTNAWELWKAAERMVTMARVFNVRQGFTPADDRLPPRTAERLGSGSGEPIDPATVEAALPLYYEMMGWDPATGVPHTAKLVELDIGWVAELLG